MQTECHIISFVYFCQKYPYSPNPNPKERTMPQPFFQFKQFTIWHDRCAMKVGTDGVLLGAWAPVASAQNILDVGTGTGLVALMLAQRCEASIVALEIDQAAAEQATENVNRSAWQSRIEVIKTDFKEYRSDKKFDVIVSNPPYFEDALQCPDHQRSTARHNSLLTYDELLKGVAGLLSPDGSFTLVVPTEAENRVKEIAFSYALHPVRQLYVVTKPNSPSKRTLITFSFHCEEYTCEYLLTEVARHQYSQEYIDLTREFYLKM